MSTKHSLLGSFLLLSLVACSGGAAPGIDELGSPPPDAVDPGPAPAPAPGPAPAPTTTTPAPTPPVAPAIAKHCNAGGPNICIENAAGRAGDIIDVEVHLVGTSACTQVLEAGGRIQMDTSRFFLANGADVVACRTRRMSQSIANPAVDDLVWAAFGGTAVGGCPPTLPMGNTDTIKIWIKPGTPAGDYKLTMSDTGFVGQDAACQTFGGTGIEGTIRVLP